MHPGWLSLSHGGGCDGVRVISALTELLVSLGGFEANISMVPGSIAWWPVREVSRKMAFWVPGEGGAFAEQVAWGDSWSWQKRPHGQKSEGWCACPSRSQAAIHKQLRPTEGSLGRVPSSELSRRIPVLTPMHAEHCLFSADRDVEIPPA